MAIRPYGYREVEGEPGGQIECPDLRIGEEGLDRSIEVKPADLPGLDQIADALQLRLNGAH